ncbi:MAG: protein-L-isoaspartate(D-aspartate) O-methyltransferase [Dehalococcoidia bacterium]|nr:protein-L-isoaspartate(D-aspartate) O-methyltransferase [Dehalococcoidia bacterium]
MRRVPRERFVPPAQQASAYEDRPLGIGYGQTISQPYIVAMMLEALELKETDKVLEVGSGSGYVTAILGELAARVIGVEIVPELVDYSTDVLAELGYDNVEIHLGSRSTFGYISEAPYDAILVSAGAPSVPPLLLAQLKWDGRMVIPVGSRWQQNLTKITRKPEGDIVQDLGGCYFVPLLGQGAWNA